MELILAAQWNQGGYSLFLVRTAKKRGSVMTTGASSSYSAQGLDWPPGLDASLIARHLASIEAICADAGRPFEEIAYVYQRELWRLWERASVVDFLPVIVNKHVRQHYAHRLHARKENRTVPA
jgi:hypothetical protein